MALNRLKKELMEIRAKGNEQSENISAGPVSDKDLTSWNAFILGPTDTPFAGGKFELSIKFPPNYPFTAPKILFKTKVFHPNIDQEGNICLDILKSNWSPVLTIGKVLLSICSLLTDPNPKDPLRPEVATLYETDRASYNEKVREYTRKYAS